MKAFNILTIGIFITIGMSNLANAIEISNEDYTQVMLKVGTSAPGGTKTTFEKGSTQFEWTFHWAAVPVPNEAKISLLERSVDGTEMKFQAAFPKCPPGCSPLLCEFSLKLLNCQAIISVIENLVMKGDQELSLPPVSKHKARDAKPKYGSIDYFKDKFGSYPPKEAQRFRYGRFVLITLDPAYGFEGDKPDNTPDKKQTCAITIRDGRLYDRQNKLFTTNVPPKAFNDHGQFIWIVSKKGKVYVTTMYGDIGQAAIGNQHSFFLKKDGYGKPIPCGGHIKASDGKITELDDGSGHYKPNLDQLLLAAHYFYTQGILSESVILTDHVLQQIYTFSDVAKIDPSAILSKYNDLS